MWSVDEAWTIAELVEEVGQRIAVLPAPKNGQVRAVPDDRTIRYYHTLGLLDGPASMRGRTALYNRRHAAQVVAIKRFQTMGRSLAEIQTLWPLDDTTLSRMSGIALGLATPADAQPSPVRPARHAFWKREPAALSPRTVAPVRHDPPFVPPASAPAAGPGVELRVDLAPNISLAIALSDDVAVSLADVAAIRAAAAPLIAELARRLARVHPQQGDDV
jgi:DNA-binding transcriptional MerR regulator